MAILFSADGDKELATATKGAPANAAPVAKTRRPPGGVRRALMRYVVPRTRVRAAHFASADVAHARDGPRAL